jgi:Flp pilus assembly pilin Flp
MNCEVWRELWRQEEGLSTVEYALLLALIVLAVAAALTELGNRMGSNVTSTATKIGNNPNP